jgi:hypothetical protein
MAFGGNDLKIDSGIGRAREKRKGKDTWITLEIGVLKNFIGQKIESLIA